MASTTSSTPRAATRSPSSTASSSPAPSPSVQAAIDASQGDSLADSEDYQSELDALDSGPRLHRLRRPGRRPRPARGVGTSSTRPGARSPSRPPPASLRRPRRVHGRRRLRQDHLRRFDRRRRHRGPGSRPRSPSCCAGFPATPGPRPRFPTSAPRSSRRWSRSAATAGTAAPDFDKELRRETGLDLGALTGGARRRRRLRPRHQRARRRGRRRGRGPRSRPRRPTRSRPCAASLSRRPAPARSSRAERRGRGLCVHLARASRSRST